MTIDQTNAAIRRLSSPGQQSSEPSNRLGKEEFLKLLTTQLAQQDPLSPVDNQAFVQQLSQMTTVEQLTNMAASIEQLALAQVSNTSAQMVSFIGKRVEISSDVVQVDGGLPSHDFGVDLSADAAEVQVAIRDENGKLVRTLDLGSRNAGETNAAWDGLDDQGIPVPDGAYTFEVTAKDVDDNPVEASTFARREVTGVTFENGYPRLSFAGDESAGLGEVREVLS